MIEEMLNNIRKEKPLIHNITNYVTVNDCANITLACGACPIMADDKEEVEEIQSICSGLNINIGTLNERTIESMFIAGKKANELSHIVTLDPVGAGASSLRTNTAKKLLKEIKFDLIKGNMSEIKTLFTGSNNTSGVDVSEIDKVKEDDIDSAVKLVKKFARQAQCIVAVTGQIDIISDGITSYIIKNGCDVMSNITGTGCMLSAMSCAYLAANQNNKLKAVASSFATMGIAGEISKEKMLKNKAGNASFRNYLIDAVYNMDLETLKKESKYECK